MTRAWRLAALLALAGLVGSSCLLLRAYGAGDCSLAGYATSLRDRTPAQVHNARLAAAAVDGQTVPPGGSFSFNRALGGWSGSRGYLKAPVSYDGRIVDAWGGGVCQLSSTLYNAALLAGMRIQERHHHHWPPRYVAPGRDAAVAYPKLDLRFANPYPWPVTIRAEVAGDRLEVRLHGKQELPQPVVVNVRVLQVIRPLVLHDPGWPGGLRLRRRGCAGYRVRVYRTVAGERELVSEDYYPALSQVLSPG